MQIIKDAIMESLKFDSPVFKGIESHPEIKEHEANRIPFLEQHYIVPPSALDHVHDTLVSHGFNEVTHSRTGFKLEPRSMYSDDAEHGKVTIQPMKNGNHYLSFSFRRSHD